MKIKLRNCENCNKNTKQFICGGYWKCCECSLYGGGKVSEEDYKWLEGAELTEFAKEEQE